MKEVKTRDLRQFGMVLAGMLGIFALVHFLKGHAHAYPWFLGVSAVSLLVSIFIPERLERVHIVFTKVAHAIGWLNTKVILCLIFYVILAPTGLLRRLFGKDPLDRKIDKRRESYWIKRNTVRASKESLEKQY